MAETNFLELDQPFQNGERPDVRVRSNEPWLVRLEGLKPTQNGAVEFPTITDFDAGGNGPAASHPYPLLHKGAKLSYAFYDTAIHAYNESALTVSATAEPVYNIAEAISPTSSESLADPDIDDTGSGDVWDDSAAASVTTDYATDEAVEFAAAADGDLARQAGADMTTELVDGTRYRGTIVIKDYVAGGVKVKLGDGSVVSDVFSGDGTFEFDLTADVTTNGNLDLIADVGLSGDASTTLKVDSVSVKEIATIAIPSGGGPWQVADFGDVWFATKESVTVARLPYFSDYALVAFTYATHGVRWRAIERLGNRLLIMGIEASTLFSGTGTAEGLRWDNFWKHWIDMSPETAFTHKDIAMNSTTVLVSTNSGGDFRFPFIQEMALFGFPARSYASDDIEDNYLDVTTKRELTFLPLPWQGTGYKLKQLGAGVAAYCSDGVSYVTGEGGVLELSAIGVREVGGIVGDTRMHYYIAKDNELIQIDAELKRTRRNLKEQMAELTGTVSASWDEEEGDAYFSDGATAYVVTPTGLGKVLDELPTTLAWMNGTLVGATVSLSDTTFTIETNDVDMGLDVQKVLVMYGINAYGVTALKGQVKFRNQRALGDAGYRMGVATLTNRSGIIYPNLPARSYRIVLTGSITAGKETSIDRLVIGYRVLDRRSLEGVVNANR